MASALESDSEDDEVLRPAFTTKTFTVTEEMVDNVLAVCPDVSREVVCSDLYYTNSISTTINRILDGRVQVSEGANALPRSSTCFTANTSAAAVTEQASSVNVVCLSDTDVDSDVEDNQDRDQDQMEVDNIAVIESISDTAHKKQSSPLTTLKKKKDICNTSEIIDLSFDDNDSDVDDNMTVLNVGNLGAHVNDISEQRKLLKDCRSQKRSSCPSSESPIPIDDDDFIVETCETRVTDVSSSDSDSDSLPSILPSLNGDSLSNTDSQDMLLNSEDSQTVVPKKKTKYTSEEVQKRKEEARLKKEMKEKDRQARKEELLVKRKEKEMEKLLKKAESLNQKSQRKEECLQNITVLVDDALLTTKESKNDDCVSPILDKLATFGVSCVIESHPIPGSITWRRASVMHSVDKDLQITKERTLSDENHVIVRVISDSFVAMVDTFKKTRNGYSGSDEQSFEKFGRTLTSTYKNKNITLLVIGLEKYFRGIKSKTARDYRNAVRGEAEQPNSKKLPASELVVSQIDVEEFLVFVELTTEFKITFCETMQDLADIITMVTKAVAEAPFKKSQPDSFSFCTDSRTASVKVSKDGQGLVKLWQQQLQQFHNVSANMAAAIVSVYPSPLLLMKAYKDCPNEHSAALLLKDILVRRGTGVLATSRRIGPELSRQVYLLFNSTDGDALTK